MISESCNLDQYSISTIFTLKRINPGFNDALQIYWNYHTGHSFGFFQGDEIFNLFFLSKLRIRCINYTL